MNEAVLHVRREEPADAMDIRRVNDDAFGQRDESRIVDAVRASGNAAVSLVAVLADGIVGHILFTPVSVEPDAPAIRVFGLGPMAVAPGRQRQGIGSALVFAGLEECRRLGCGLVVVIGHPEFYPRFGFRPGAAHGLRSAFAVPDDAFMVLELMDGALNRVKGVVRYAPEFGSD